MLCVCATLGFQITCLRVLYRKALRSGYMAAGRHGGYHDNEFKDRDSDFELLKEDFAYSEDKYDRIENGNAANDRGQVRDLRDRARIRQKGY
ncbi:hypothetical protein OIU74_017867 [Salix koriyanagi]|uniref:Uncharacterized protein n=1 Tax=Salix koriyanagi TaxID=2511006 RepID=A0A9Q1AHN1_9ROSI|nr:hypothetical protein OIU74_017867 [Salix koriyanagi]